MHHAQMYAFMHSRHIHTQCRQCSMLMYLASGDDMYRYAPQMMHHASGVDKETYLKRVQELDPIIRYCKYNVQRQVRIIVLGANV